MNIQIGFGGLLVAMTLVAGCSAGPARDGAGDVGDVGDTEPDTDEGALSTARCDRSAILASVSGDRKHAIERGFEWFDDQVPYSQSRYHDHYRTDCSGFVSMCWELGTSQTSATFIEGNAGASILSSYDELIPGDALVYRSHGRGHTVLFLGWAGSNHDNACVLELRSAARDMQFHTRSTASLHSTGFQGLRADKF